MKVLFTIPARESTDRPGLHLALVGGVPLVGRAARLGRLAARTLGHGCRVVCATDSSAIGEAAAFWGADVLLVDAATLAAGGGETLDAVFQALGAPGDYRAVVLLNPANPLTDVDDVLGALGMHRDSGCPVVSVSPVEHAAAREYQADDTGPLSRLLPIDKPLTWRHDRISFRENGALYLSTPAALRERGPFFGPGARAFVIPVARSLQVNTAGDLQAARGVVAHHPVLPVAIDHRMVGPGSPCFVIAEAGVNHNGDLALAEALVDAAADAGADAVKFQTFRAERVVTREAPKAEYQVRTTGAHETQFDMLKRLELGQDAHRALVDRCRALGLIFLSTPFDEESCDFLDALGVPAFKVPSGEVTNLPFIRHVARKQKPIILSTGMACLREVADAVEAVWDEGNRSLVLLHCVSNYPTDPEDANLRAIATLREAFGVPAGFSDHTVGVHVALAAVALGACLIEKHVTLDRTLPGPDHYASIEPDELRELVRRMREVEASLGSGTKEPVAREAAVARVTRRSLVAARPIPAGTVVERTMVVMRRPGTGLTPDQLPLVVGRTALVDIPEGALLAHEMLG